MKCRILSQFFKTGGYMERVKLKIKRFDGKKEWFDEYEIDIDNRTTIIEALMKIHDTEDPTLSFRVQCRAAICGTCGVKINGENMSLPVKPK